MVFFNYATMQMAAKIVYYGPGLCGKTTNLHHIYAKTSPQSRGEMVSLETETDRTLFFDLLPIDVGVIGGFKTRLQLYTVPGQVFYNTTRKLVLKGVDGIVFVADSQRAMLEANVESFKNLRDNLAEIGLNLDEVPIVIQLNKRDLPNVVEVATMVQALDPEERHEHIEASAVTGAGVFETLKLISKMTLRTLRRRMTGEEPVKPAARRPDMGQFRVKDDGSAAAKGTTGARPAIKPPLANKTDPIPAYTGQPPAAAASATAASASTATSVSERLSTIAIAEPEPVPEPIEMPAQEARIDPADAIPAGHVSVPQSPLEDDSTSPFETGDPEKEQETPSATQYTPAATPAAAAPVEAAPAAEPEIEFGQIEKPARAAPEMKHVKVRSSVDIMAELESLRKRATTSTSTSSKSSRKESAAAEASAAAARSLTDLQRTMTLSVPAEALSQARRLRITVSFENDEGAVAQQEQSVELGETPDVHSVSVNLKIESA
jgi:signal recognition particle receptor subunit beta